MVLAAKAFLNTQEAAERVGCSRGRIRNWIAKNEIPHTKIGDKVVIPAEALERWLAARNDAALAQVKEAQS